jgi:hypothetical protein
MAVDRTTTWCGCAPVSDVDGGDSPTVAVVEALAAARGVRPTELEPLHDVIDCGALDRSFERGAGTVASSSVLSFSVDGWNVFVRDDGLVRVGDPDAAVEPAPVFERPFQG